MTISDAGREPAEGFAPKREAALKTEGAKREAADRIRRRIFAALSVLVVLLSVLAIGSANEWAFLRDFGGPLENYHWEVWRDLIAAIIGGSAASWAISFGFTQVAVKSVLNQLVEANTTNVYQTITNDYSSSTTSDPAVSQEISRLREQVKELERLLIDRQADPAHVRQLEDLMRYAHDERVKKLQAQLAIDVQLFEKFRGIASALAAECEKARNDSRAVG